MVGKGDMESMKKYLYGLIVALALTGCGAKSDGEETPVDENAGQFVLNDGTEGGGQETNIPEREPVLYRYETGEVRFEIQSVNPNAPEGYEMKLLFENKIDAAELYFSLEDFAVQRWELNVYRDYIGEHGLGSESGVVTVEPLSVKEFSVYLDPEALSEVGITTVDEIVFHFRAWNWDYISGSVAYEEAKVYPTGKNEDSIIVPEANQAQDVLAELENDSLSVILLGFEAGEGGRIQAKLLVENKKDERVLVEFPGGNRVLNGERYDGSWIMGFYLDGKTRCYIELGLNHEEFETLSHIVSPDQINGFEASVNIYYTDEAQQYQSELYRLVY